MSRIQNGVLRNCNAFTGACEMLGMHLRLKKNNAFCGFILNMHSQCAFRSSLSV